MDITRISRHFQAPAAFGLLAACCAHHPEHQSEDIHMQNIGDTPAAQIATSAGDIGGRVLSLIDSIRSREDLAQDHIERVTGLKLHAEPDTVYLYGTRGVVANGWRYRLGAMAGDDDGVGSLLFSFNPPGEEPADMAPVCDPDFDAYRATLEAKGFGARRVPGARDSTRFWEFHRDGVIVRIHTIGESDARPDHACVSTVSIQA